MSINHNFFKRKESRSGSNRGPSAYQPSALPLSHTGSPQGHKGTNLIFVAVWMFSLSVVPEKESQQNDLFSAEDVVVVFLHPGLHDALITMVFILVYLR